MVIGTLILFFFVVKLIGILHRKVRQSIIRSTQTKIKAVKMGSYEFLNAQRIGELLLAALSLIRFFTVLVTFYFLLPLVFSFFPQTQTWADQLIGFVLNPVVHLLQAFINYLPNLFRIIVITFIFYYIVKAVRYLSDEIAKGSLVIPGFYADWAPITFGIFRFLLYAFMLVLIFPYLPGSNSPAFQGVSVFLGLLFSLGSTSAIGNMVAGLVITYMRPFKLGDLVKTGDIRGIVIEKSILVTRIRTIKNEEITVPNSKILSDYAVNYSKMAADGDGLIIHTEVTIGYDAPWETVHELLIKAALRTEGVEAQPTPFVHQTALSDFYVCYEINAYTKQARIMAHIYSTLHQNIQDCFNEAGLEIMSPHYSQLRDGNTTTTPASYRPSDYKPQEFNIRK
jgi:small-conductance mechanosensitive channel